MANDINHVVLVGRLTRDSELKYTNTGTAIGKFSIAVNRRKRSGDQWTDEVSYFDIVLWGKTAEALNQYLQKGKQVAVSGELRQNRWEQDGQNRSKVEIIANNLQLLGGMGGRNDSPESRPSDQDTPPSDTGSYSDDFEDDIPF